MSTPVIQSLNTGAGDAGTTVTVTKPSGTVDGNTLLAIVFSYDGVGAVIPSLESGWTNVGTGSASGDFTAYRVMTKIAASEGASYTFDSPSTVDSLRAIVFRITGANSAEPARIAAGSLATSTTTPSITISLSPRSADALFIMGLTGNASTTGITTSGYTISGTNPTWTERYDDTEGSDHMFAVASANAGSQTTVTSVGATYSSTVSAHLGFLIELSAQNDEAGTAALGVTEPFVPTTAGIAGTSATTALGTTEPYIPATSGEGITPTSWDTINKS